MAVYLKIFSTMSAYEDFITSTADYPKPNISYIEATDEVIFTNYRDTTSIEFDSSSYSMTGNEESSISVPFSVIDNWGDDVTENCTFTFSPNDKGLYVDNGYIKVDSAIEGTYNVTITATLGDFTASATIAMQIAAIPHSISFNSNSYTLSGDEGTSITTSYTVTDDLNNDVTANAVITFDNAYVTANNGTFSVANGVTAGTYTTVATATVGSLTTTATINITVVAVPTSISFDSNSYTMSGTEGDTITQSYTVTNDLNQDVTSQAVITFSPSNTGITASNGTFNASSVSAGSYTITATATVGNLTTTATINLTVAAVPTSIAFDSNSYTLSGTEYDTIQQQFAVTDNLGNDVSLQCSYSMNPNNTDMVITNVGGQYYAFDASSVSAGTYSVTVTATYNNLTATATVAMNIAAAGPSSIEFDESSYNGTGTEFEPGQYINFVVYDENEDDVAPQCSYSFSPNDTGITADLSGGQWGCNFDFSDVAAGNYTITVTATLGNLSTTSTINLTIASAQHDYSQDYLTFEALESGTFTLTIPAAVDTNYMTSISYSTDNGDTWTTTNIDNTDQTITTPTIAQGDKVLWKGEGTSLGKANTVHNYSYFSSTVNFNASGNIMSLLYGNNFANQTTFPSGSTYTFNGLFNVGTSSRLSSIENLILPATTLTNYCYGSLFQGCTLLTTLPTNFLPATTLATSCYWAMFQGCTSLTTLPTNFLPATTLANYCYGTMFNGCTSLASVPSDLLPATTLAQNCYAFMFQGCTSLTTLPTNFLPATTLATSCYSGMFNGCTSLASVPSDLLPATTLANQCYGELYGKGMFHSCTSLTTAPILPATRLQSACYGNMFNGCTNLSSITMLATTLVNNALNNWVNNVAASGTFTKAAAMTTLPSGVSGVPNNWTVVDAS